MKIILEKALREDAFLFTTMEQAIDVRDFVIPYTREMHEKGLCNPGLVYLRILAGDSLAGFFILVPDPDTLNVEFRRIVVSIRGRGIGQMAIREMESYCTDVLSRTRIWLDVFEDNVRGRHIYEKLGYRFFSETLHENRRLCLYEKLLTSV
ncbi:hypothetical protein BTA51_13360 [Hahella sp. CCB-MM4]|uniref:GNAT family N-acetyltransferase n=1 Tax=Hahella sp. (strain CCB-MM4) TaxID=1926491 RepID=UPI000B9B0B00|nr:GNAT family N-acetyltransferase [Hahella sp. CCB-MM4]OZG72943.1 hypothetical protein BTA51_13360 [Hahella sp. CCB-MM4]